MDTLANVAHQRRLMATIADLIVTAATGKALRVAVGWTRPDETPFVDHLTRALHARGRRCHYLTPKPHCVTTDGSTPAHGQAGGPMVAVITSGGPAADENEPCRINIQLDTPTQVSPSAAAAQREPDARDSRRVGGHQPDIIVDFCDPGGPTLRHIVPSLMPQPHDAAGSQSDRKAGRP
jgi:hypothetical protein